MSAVAQSDLEEDDDDEADYDLQIKVKIKEAAKQYNELKKRIAPPSAAPVAKKSKKAAPVDANGNPVPKKPVGRPNEKWLAGVVLQRQLSQCRSSKLGSPTLAEPPTDLSMWKMALGSISKEHRHPYSSALLQLSVLLLAPTAALAWKPPKFISSRWPPCNAWDRQVHRIVLTVGAAAKRSGGGNALVVGANTGPGPGGVDPTFNWLVSKAAGQLLQKVVFVEPVPAIFRALQRNLLQAHASNAIPLNLGIANESGTLNIYCLGLTEDAANRGVGISDEAAKLGVPGWATGTCSLNRDRLYSKSDFSRRGKFGASDAMRN